MPSPDELRRRADEIEKREREKEQKRRQKEIEERREREREEESVRAVLRRFSDKDLKRLAEDAAAVDHSSNSLLRESIQTVRRDGSTAVPSARIGELAQDVLDERRRERAPRTDGGTQARAATVEIGGKEIPYWVLAIAAVGVGLLAGGGDGR